MTQLILDANGEGLTLPESIKSGYRAWEEDGGVELEMISRRLVRELRGRVWRVAYQYGYFDEATKNKVIDVCKKGQLTPIVCAFLPPNSEEMQSAEFFVTTFNYPRFMWSSEGKPLWADFSLELREVNPHD